MKFATATEFDTPPTAAALVRAYNASASRADRAVRFTYSHAVVEVELDFQTDRATAYVVNEDGDVTAENELATVNFDMEINRDARFDEALQIACEAAADFLRTVA